jgi:uncharacterized protein
MRLLLWAAIAFVLVVWALRSKKPASSSSQDSSKPDAAEAMLKCVHCGIHIPSSEALITKSGVVFCCEEHRLQNQVG